MHSDRAQRNSTTFNLQLFGAPTRINKKKKSLFIVTLSQPYSSQEICIFTNEGYSSAGSGILQLSRPASAALLQLFVHHQALHPNCSSSWWWSFIFLLCSCVQQSPAMPNLLSYADTRGSERAGGQCPRKGNLYSLSIKEDRLITGLTRAACGSLCHRIGIIIYHQSALLLWHKERPQMDLTNKQTERRIMCLLWMQVR